MAEKTKLLFEIKTPLGFVVRCSQEYWEFIVTEKHPSLKGREEEVKAALSAPDEIRRSRQDKDVYLFYKTSKPYWICAVTKDAGGAGFLITAYQTDAIKAGDVIWKK